MNTFFFKIKHIFAGIGILLLVTFVSCNKEQMEVIPDTDLEKTDLSESDLIPGKYIVTFKESYLQPSSRNSPTFRNRDAKIAYAENARTNATVKVHSFLQKERIDEEKVDHIYTSATSGFAGSLTKKEVLQLKANPNVLSIEQDRIITSDGTVEPTLQFHLDARAQTVDCAVTSAAGSNTTSGPSWKWIWILDTGIDKDHPDLNVKTYSNIAIDLTGGGNYDDCNGHGTHIAGIAAAKNNSIGVLGVSPGAPVIPVKIMTGCTKNSSWSLLIAGLNHVAKYDIPGDVVNLSLTGRQNNCNVQSGLTTAINSVADAGTFIAIASGNNFADSKDYAPGCINRTNIFTVGAINCGKTFQSWSNYNSSYVDYVAGGSQVYSTNKDGGYITMSGTSMAAPVVAGILHARQARPRLCSWVPIPYKGDYYGEACK